MRDTDSTLLIFAYGSNMLSRRLQARTPSALPLGIARLQGHALRWHKAGRDGSAKCDVVETGDPGDAVHGVLFRVCREEKSALDAVEGLGAGYAEKRAGVHSMRGRVEAWLYYATAIDGALLPFDWYRDLVLYGAREHGLPAAHVAAIKRVRTMPDPDTERAARIRQMLEAPPADVALLRSTAGD